MNTRTLEDIKKEWEEALAETIPAKLALKKEQKLRVELISALGFTRHIGTEHLISGNKKFTAIHKQTVKFDPALYSKYHSRFNKSEQSCFTLEPKLSLTQYKELKQAGKINNLDRALVSKPALPTLSEEIIENEDSIY